MNSSQRLRLDDCTGLYAVFETRTRGSLDNAAIKEDRRRGQCLRQIAKDRISKATVQRVLRMPPANARVLEALVRSV